MKARYKRESGAEFDEAGDIAIRLKVLAGEVYNMQTHMEWLRRQLFPSTATGVFLDRFAQQRGLERRPAIKAAGQLTFRVNETKNYSLAIPRGTAVSTDTDSPVRLYTTEEGEIEAGSYSVTIPAEAEIAGYRGNIKINTAVVPVSVPAEIDSVTNYSTFKGGANEESDTTLRARILESYVNQPNGMNASYYTALATSVEGVSKAGVVGKARGAGTVNIYVASTDGSITNDKLREVQQVVENERELNVDVLVAAGGGIYYDLYVTVTAKAGYEAQEVIAKCTDAFEDYLSSLPMGGKLYLPNLGKYLLDTGCIETYEFNPIMDDMSLPGSQFFIAGDVEIEVE